MVCQKLPRVYKKTLKCIGNNSWMSSPGVTFNLTCGKVEAERKNLTNIRLSSFAESHEMQQKNFDVSPLSDPTRSRVVIWVKNNQTELMVEIYSKSLVRAIGEV